MRTLVACTLMNVDFHQFWTRALGNFLENYITGQSVQCPRPYAWLNCYHDRPSVFLRLIRPPETFGISYALHQGSPDTEDYQIPALLLNVIFGIVDLSCFAMSDSSSCAAVPWTPDPLCRNPKNFWKFNQATPYSRYIDVGDMISVCWFLMY